MNILLVLIPVTLVIMIIAVRLFFWAVNHQQFDDLDSPGILPLLDEPAADEPATKDPTAADSASVEPPAAAPDAARQSAGAAPPAAGDAAADRPD